MLRKLGIAAIIITVALIGLLFFASRLPDTFHVERAASIKARPEKIYPLIASLSAFHSWEPFSKRDPAIKIAYNGTDSGTGAQYSWAGNSEVGEGQVEITDVSPPSKVTMKLDMVRPMAAHNVVNFTLTPKGDGTTTVSWEMSGRRPLIGKVLDVLLDMDKMVGGAFNSGLANLKALAEK